MCIHVPHMKSLVLTMLPGVLHTDDVNASGTDDDTYKLHRLHLAHWPNLPKATAHFHQIYEKGSPRKI